MRRTSVVALLAVVSVGLSANAQTLVTTKYDPTACFAVESGLNTSATLVRSNTGNTTTATLKNISSGAVNVFCPIIKTTSGPGITNDEIWDANVPVTVPAGQDVQCGIEVFDNQIFIDGSNFVESAFTEASTSGTMNIGFQSNFGSPQDYWDGFGTAPSWYYADIECQLAPGASLGPGYYGVDEE